jgi:hypothetical protein
MEQENSVVNYLPREYNSEWYRELSSEMKRTVFMDALKKHPYLAQHMKINKIKASDPNFVNHYTFKLMIEILRS